MSNLAPPSPLRRSCALPNCDECCTYCRENDRIAAARRGLPFLAPDVAAASSPFLAVLPSPTTVPQLAFGGAATGDGSGSVVAAQPATAPQPAAAPQPAVLGFHPSVTAAQAAVTAGTITQGSSEWWAHVLGTTNAPTLEEYNALPPEQQDAWTCIVCGWEPALADSPQPGRVCSYECLYDKYR